MERRRSPSLPQVGASQSHSLKFQAKASFLSVPFEIRVIIYRDVFSSRSRNHPRIVNQNIWMLESNAVLNAFRYWPRYFDTAFELKHSVPLVAVTVTAPLRVCKQIYSEAYPIFYSMTPISVRISHANGVFYEDRDRATQMYPTPSAAFVYKPGIIYIRSLILDMHSVPGQYSEKPPVRVSLPSWIMEPRPRPRPKLEKPRDRFGVSFVLSALKSLQALETLQLHIHTFNKKEICKLCTVMFELPCLRRVTVKVWGRDAVDIMEEDLRPVKDVAERRGWNMFSIEEQRPGELYLLVTKKA